MGAMKSHLLESASHDVADDAGAGDQLPTALESYRVLPARQAAMLLGLSEATLERLRYTNEGPVARRLSARRLGYRISDLLAWLDARAAA